MTISRIDLIQFLRGTAAAIAAENPIPYAGEPVFATDAGTFKIGNGSTAYNSLVAIGSGAVATDAIWDAAGDLAVGTGANTAARLAMGTALQVLRVNAGATALEWGAAPGVGDALVANPLSQFAATSSAQLRSVLSDENGTGVFICNSNTNQILATPAISGGTINSAVIGGTTPAAGTFTALQATGNVTVDGDLLVSGDTITINTATLSVEDPLIKLAKNNNAAHAVDIGLYGLYHPSATDLYSGLFFDATDSKWKLFAGLEVEPMTTVNTAGTGYTAGTLVANLEGNATGNAGTVTVADAAADATCWPLLARSQTGDQAPATDGSLTFNAATNTLTCPIFSGALDGTATAVALGGITGLGAGVATFAATPSSANLLAAVTDETGSGLLVFATGPVLTTPSVTGILTTDGAQVTTANAMGALAVDVTKGLNTKSISADSTLTFSGTPATANTWFAVRLKNTDTAPHIVTFPSSFDVGAQSVKTTCPIAASGTLFLAWCYDGSVYNLLGAGPYLSKFDATVAPAVTDDVADGYGPGSLWGDATGNALYWCESNGAGAAVWNAIAGGYSPGGTDVAVTDGGTGRSTSTTAYGLLAAGTTATGVHQTLAAGLTTEMLVGGGASALAVWTTATGTGAPVRATSPTLVTPLLDTPTSGTLTNCTGLPAAGVVGTAAILGVNVFTALQTITPTSGTAITINATAATYTAQKVQVNEFATLVSTTDADKASNASYAIIAPGDTYGRFAFGLDTGAPFFGLGPGNLARDVFLYREAAAVLALRDSTNVQTLRIYGTASGAPGTDYVRAALTCSTTAVTLAAQTAGAGADDIDVNITPAGIGGVLLGAFFQQFTEMTAPAAPATNAARVYSQDNGSGKTQLMAKFATGAAVQLAIEP